MNVDHNQAKRRFEVSAGGVTAMLVYDLAPGEIIFVHTEVPKQLEGKGVGATLVKAGLEYARGAGLRIVPRCPFVRSYLEKHPEAAGV
jgi:predicted GNAT family acetyltransferase